MNEAGASLFAMVLACLRGFGGLGPQLHFYAEKLSGLAIAFENPDNANFYYAELLDPLLPALPAYGLLFPLAVAGMVVAGRRAGALLPALPLALSLFASILLTTTLSRYRAAFAVFLFPVAGLALATGFAAAVRRDWRRLALVLGCAVPAWGFASLVEARIEKRAGLSGLRYRPPEFHLAADAWERRGQPGRAAAEMLSLVRHNRDPRIQAWALVRGATLLAASRDRYQADQALSLAVRTGRRDAALLMAAGDARSTSLRDPAGARALYQEALGLLPAAELRTQLEERLRLMEGAGSVK
jgi:hypothetical protein